MNRRILFIVLGLAINLNLAAQNKMVRIDRSAKTPTQVWTLKSIHMRLFTTICKWEILCSSPSEKIQIPLDAYIEDCETHKRYPLSIQPKSTLSQSYNSKNMYEAVFQGMPQNVRRVNIVSSMFSLNNIDLNSERSNVASQSTKESTIEESRDRSISSANESLSNPSIRIRCDIDINIPESKQRQENVFVVIIANENYQEVAEVPYAINDGTTFKEYCIKALGIPDDHIHFIKNATLNNIQRQIAWLEKVMAAYNGEGKLIFYYAGHGIPDEKEKSAYLLPVDGVGNDPSTGYSLDQLYKTLGQMPAQSSIVIMDACFSGAKRDGGMLASARGVAIKPKPQEPKGNMFILSAAQGDETAYPYQEKGHGMFTYYLLKGLQNSKGDISLGELSEYIIDNVRKQSIVKNGKSQTPCVSASGALKDSWKTLKLR